MAATHPTDLLRKQIEKLIKLPDESWALLEPFVTAKAVPKNQLLVQEGKMVAEIGMVVTGALHQFYTRDGEEKSTYFYFENAFVGGYISCITQSPSELSIEALTDSELLVFPYAKLKALFAENIYWANFGRLLAEWALIGLETRMVDRKSVV